MTIRSRQLAAMGALIALALWAAAPADAQEAAAPAAPVAEAPIPEPSFDVPAVPGEGEAELGDLDALAEAEAEALAGEEGPAEVDIDFAEVLGYGGLVGYAIVALSVIALALAALFFYELRNGSLMPTGVYSAIRTELERNGADAALQRSQRETSFLGHVLAAGLDALRDGRAEARAVMADAADTWMAGSVRRIEYLNLIATVSPMLGLLGTVVGMVKTFAALAQSTGPIDPVELSAGIFQALVTTMMGLAVAIPTLLLYTVLRNRADHIQTTVVAAGEQLVSRLGGSAPVETPAAEAAAS